MCTLCRETPTRLRHRVGSQGTRGQAAREEIRKRPALDEGRTRQKVAMPAEQGGPERLPPQSRDAERSVLGSMLRENAVIGDVVQIIREEHFYSDAHQKIYRGIVTLRDRGQPVDLVILAAW